MQWDKIKNGYRLTIASFSEAIQLAIDGNANVSEGQRSSREKGRKDFTGTDTFEDAVDITLEGWDEGRKAIIERQDFLNKTFDTSVGPSDSYGPAGAFPSVPLFLSGTPECMYMPEYSNEKPVRSILINGAAHGQIEKGVMFNRGAVLINFIDELEGRGVSCKVDVGFAIESNTDDSVFEVVINIKEQGQHFDLDDMSFALCHPAMFRRFCFSYIEQIPDAKIAKELVEHGYGHPTELEKEFTEQYDIYISRLENESDFESGEKAFDSLFGKFFPDQVEEEHAPKLAPKSDWLIDNPFIMHDLKLDMGDDIKMFGGGSGLQKHLTKLLEGKFDLGTDGIPPRPFRGGDDRPPRGGPKPKGGKNRIKGKPKNPWD